MAGRQRGFSFVEGLVASAILMVALTGMFSLWAGLFSRFTRAREVAQAAQLARAEVERAKVYGVDKLPIGTYNASTKIGTWTGSFNPSTGLWITGGSTYYTLAGVPTASAAGAKMKVQNTITDTNVLLRTGGYGFRLNSKRAFSSTVTRLPDGEVLLKVGTYLAQGGL